MSKVIQKKSQGNYKGKQILIIVDQNSVSEKSRQFIEQMIEESLLNSYGKYNCARIHLCGANGTITTGGILKNPDTIFFIYNKKKINQNKLRNLECFKFKGILTSKLNSLRRYLK
jgi:hypothetical protein